MTYQGLEEAFSLERFGRYLAWAGGDRERAIALCSLNTALSETLYTPMQVLEVALRNRIHAVMSRARHAGWFNDAGILIAPYQQDQLAKALRDLGQRNKPATPGRVVAELTFGFWTAMLGSSYENLWQTTLHHIAVRPNGKGLQRKDLSSPLERVRKLRNRVAHHEPILREALKDRYGEILTLTEWLSPPAAAWCRQHSRFDQVYPPAGIPLVIGNTKSRP